MKKIMIILVLAMHSIAVVGQDSWVIEAKNIDSSNYYGATVANGMIGIISSPEPLKVKEVILAGVYDNYGRGRVSNFLPSFNLLNMEMSVGGIRIDKNTVRNLEQRLDLKKAEFTTSFDVEDIASVVCTYRSLRHLPHSVLMDVFIKMKKSSGIAVDNIHETPYALQNQQNYYNVVDRPHAQIPLLTTVAESPHKRHKIVASNSILFFEKLSDRPRIIHKMNDNNSHMLSFNKEIAAGEEYHFSIIGTLISSVQHVDPYNQAERSTIFAYLEGSEKLTSRHYAEWNKLWEGNITIEGDKQVQQDVRSMLYHLYSFVRPHTDFSPSPMGLSGIGYNGHVFWDSEIFMFPPLLLFHPSIAKSLINYRYNRLGAAQQNALLNGYQGAMYPWESADSGVEETPVWALTGPFEHHITANVGIASWNYYLVTRDKEWLQKEGWPILYETAKFWESRVEKNSKGEFEIKNVVAADEWAENVDNNAYTNGAAIRLLKSAISCAQELKVSYPQAWHEIVNNIPIRTLTNGVTSEYDGYDGRAIKQADVNLLAYPLGIITDREQIKKDLKYYQERVPQKETPAMTEAIFALLYSRLGEGDEAYHWLKDAYEENLLPPFRVIAETKGGTNPYFATGAGGILQAIMMGFCGIDIAQDGGLIQVKSSLPKHWKRVIVEGVGSTKETFIRE